MLSWLRSRVDSLRNTKVKGLSLISNWLAGTLWLIEAKFLPLARETYGSNEVIYACLRLLAQSVPEPPLVAYQQDGNGEKTPVSPDHPLMQLIKVPNELMTEYEFWELTTIYMAIIGKAFWWKKRDNAGRLVSLWPLRPDRVGPIYSDSDQPGETVLWGWSYQVPGTGQFQPIPRRDMLAFNFPDPAGESGGIVEGLGPVQALARMVASDNEATKFVGALLANYALPGLVVKCKREFANRQEAITVKEHFRAEFGGANRGNVAVLDAETEVSEVGFNLRELEFPELREISESRISAALGVPAVLVGMSVGLKYSHARASITELREYFTETTLAAYWRRYSDQYNNDIASEFGEGIVCEFDTTQVKALAMQLQQHIAPVTDAFKVGALTLNEYRAVLQMPALPGGDLRLVPTNVTEIPTVPADQTATRSVLALPHTRLLSAGQDGGNGHGNGHAALKVADPRDQHEEELKKALQKLFAVWAPDIADKLSRGEMPSDTELQEGFRRVIEPQLIQAATDEGIRLAAEIGVRFDIAVVNQAAAEWAKSYAYDLVRGLTDTSQSVLRQAMERYTKTPGMTMVDLRGLLDPVFGDVRAEMISITEVTRAYSQATNQYQKQLEGVGLKMVRYWHTSADENVCPICAPLNGRAESMWSAEHPGGPPAHVRCRCMTTLSAAKKAVEVAA